MNHKLKAPLRKGSLVTAFIAYLLQKCKTLPLLRQKNLTYSYIHDISISIQQLNKVSNGRGANLISNRPIWLGKPGLRKGALPKGSRCPTAYPGPSQNMCRTVTKVECYHGKSLLSHGCMHLLMLSFMVVLFLKMREYT